MIFIIIVVVVIVDDDLLSNVYRMSCFFFKYRKMKKSDILDLIDRSIDIKIREIDNNVFFFNLKIKEINCSTFGSTYYFF